MLHLSTHFIRRLIGALSLVVLALELLHMQYLEAQRQYDDEALKISSATRIWQYLLWISPGLATLGAFLIYPLFLQLGRSSKTVQALTLPRSAVLILVFALLYFPVQELAVSLFFAVAFHALASFGGREDGSANGESGSPGLAATFRNMHFCGSREGFEATLPQRYQDRLLELSRSGPYRLRDDTYLQCHIIRTHSWIMILLGLLVLHQVIFAYRKPSTKIPSQVDQLEVGTSKDEK